MCVQKANRHRKRSSISRMNGTREKKSRIKSNRMQYIKQSKWKLCCHVKSCLIEKWKKKKRRRVIRIRIKQQTYDCFFFLFKFIFDIRQHRHMKKRDTLSAGKGIFVRVNLLIIALCGDLFVCVLEWYMNDVVEWDEVMERMKSPL